MNDDINSESNEANHFCENCNKGFKEKHKLRRHMMVHTGEKKFICYYCGKPFSLDYNLKTHLRIHTGEKPFKCRYENCEKSFAQSGNLKTHERTKHGVDIQELIKIEEIPQLPRRTFDSIICQALSKILD